MSQPIVEIRNLKKSYEGVTVLEGINLSIFPGRIHGLYGLNGAGKTTLINLLSGTRKPDSGEIIVNGASVRFSSPLDAKKAGFATIYQNCEMSQNITAAEYLHMCLSVMQNREFKACSFKKMNANCQQLLDELDLKIKPTDRISSLSAGHKQLLQIAAAISLKPRLIMLDEPYSMLTSFESKRLSDIFLNLKNQGIAMLMVSHDTGDIASMCDEVTILENGRFCAHYISGSPEFKKWVDMFDYSGPVYSYPYIPKNPTRIMLSVENICTNGILRDVSFQLRKGEILGVAGLLGSGRSSLSRALFGVDAITSGRLIMNGERLRLRSPSDAIKHKISLVPEDIIREGIIPSFSVSRNISLSNLSEITPLLLSTDLEDRIARRYIKQYVIKTPSASEPTRNLSAGNQQKVNIVKWLFTNSSVLIMDDPTQNVDISTKVEIYNFMNKFTSDGGSILFISSDFDELLGMSDRIIVMKHGRITQTLARSSFSDEKLIKVLSE